MQETNDRPAETQDVPADDRRKKMWLEVFDWVRTIVVTLVVALLFQNFVFTLARVDGPSMQDTLHTSQLMAVLRVHYYFSTPQRGQVVLCRYPNYEEDCVKRVIGLPGETIHGENNTIYIDGVPLEEPYLTRPEFYDFAPVTIPEGEYFVIGDNRGNSLDSRAIGSLPRSKIKGQCLSVVYPFSEIGGIPQG